LVLDCSGENRESSVAWRGRAMVGGGERPRKEAAEEKERRK